MDAVNLPNEGSVRVALYRYYRNLYDEKVTQLLETIQRGNRAATDFPRPAAPARAFAIVLDRAETFILQFPEVVKRLALGVQPHHDLTIFNLTDLDFVRFLKQNCGWNGRLGIGDEVLGNERLKLVEEATEQGFILI